MVFDSPSLVTIACFSKEERYGTCVGEETRITRPASRWNSHEILTSLVREKYPAYGQHMTTSLLVLQRQERQEETYDCSMLLLEQTAVPNMRLRFTIFVLRIEVCVWGLRRCWAAGFYTRQPNRGRCYVGSACMYTSDAHPEEVFVPLIPQLYRSLSSVLMNI